MYYCPDPSKHSFLFQHTDKRDQMVSFNKNEFADMSHAVAEVLCSQPAENLLLNLKSSGNFRNYIRDLYNKGELSPENLADQYIATSQIYFNFEDYSTVCVSKTGNRDDYCKFSIPLLDRNVSLRQCKQIPAARFVTPIVCAALMAMCANSGGKLAFSSTLPLDLRIPGDALYETVFDKPFNPEVSLDIPMENISAIGFYDHDGQWYDILNKMGIDSPNEFVLSCAKTGPNMSTHIALLNEVQCWGTDQIACPKSLELKFQEYLINENLNAHEMSMK